MLGNIVGGFIAILFGIMLFGPLTEQIDLAKIELAESNETMLLENSWGATIINLVPGFFALCLFGVGICTAYFGLKNAGLLGDNKGIEDNDYDEDEEDDEDSDDKIASLVKKGAELPKRLKQVEKPLPKVDIKEKDLMKSRFD